MEHLLGAHFEDHIGMGAHPRAAPRDLAQQRIEIGAVSALVNRVHPYKHAIERGELCAHGVDDIVLIDHGFCVDTDIGERREDGLEPAGLWRGTAARCFIASPEDSDAAESSCGMKHGKRLRVSFFYVTACLYTFSTRRAVAKPARPGAKATKTPLRENTPRTKSSMLRFHD